MRANLLSRVAATASVQAVGLGLADPESGSRGESRLAIADALSTNWTSSGVEEQLHSNVSHPLRPEDPLVPVDLLGAPPLPLWTRSYLLPTVQGHPSPSP